MVVSESVLSSMYIGGMKMVGMHGLEDLAMYDRATKPEQAVHVTSRHDMHSS